MTGTDKAARKLSDEERFALDPELSGPVRLVGHFTSNARKYRITCFEAAEVLTALAPKWQALEDVSPEPFDYFQTYDWCLNWVETYGKTGEFQFRVYVLEDGLGPLMLLPMMVSANGFGGIRIMEPISEPLGQYANILYHPSRASDDLGRKFWDVVKADRQADAICFRYYPEDGMLARMVGSEGFDEGGEAGNAVSSYLDYSKIPDWDAYKMTGSKSRRKQMRSRIRKLEALGELRLDVHYHDSDQFSRFVDKAIELKRVWLDETARHSQSLFDDASMQFLRSLGSHRGKPGQGPMVHVLNLDKQPIGIEIAMLRGSHYYTYLGAIDMEWKNYSPGKVQMEFSQKWGFENGISYYDYLCDPSDYKSGWTNATAPMLTRYFPLTVIGSGYCNIWKARLRPALRTAYRNSPENVRRSLNRLLAIAGSGGGNAD